MASWTGKTKGNVLGYKIFVLILKHLNIRVAYFVLYFVAFYYFLFTKKESIHYYFKEIHHYSPLRTTISVYKNFLVFGKILIDRVAILAGFSKKFSFTFQGEEYLHQMARDNTGGVLLGAHMGNWEIAGQLLQRIDTKVNIVMFDGEQQNIKNYIDSVVSEKKIGIIFIQKDNFNYLKEIDQALKNKEMIAIHGDRVLPGSSNTVTCNFMGKPADFPTGPMYLASKYQVPVTYVSAIKETTTHYHFYATEPKIFPYPAKLSQRKVMLQQMLTDYVKNLEKMLWQYPLQWFNYYHFWKTP